MFKKLFYFLFYIAPMTALGVTYNPGTGNSVGADGSLVGINAGETVIVSSGNGIKVGTGGILLSGNMYVGQDNQGAATGQLYIETNTDPVFTIVSEGDIDVAGSLNVNSGWTLGISGLSSPVNASFGSVSNNGILDISNIETLITGSVDSWGDLSFSSVDMNLGSVVNNTGYMILSSVNNLQIAQLVSDSSNSTSVSANDMVSGSIQNNLGDMEIILSGVLGAGGSIENSGTQMNIIATDVTVDGTIKNDSNSGTMLLNLSSLTVNGGDALNASFVNKGDLYVTVSGATHLEYGFDLSAMSYSNEFSFETGTLTFGSGMSIDSWLQLFANNLNLFELTINNGDITANNVINGELNSGANMKITAQSVHVDDVSNFGDELNMIALSTTGGIYISGGLTGAAGSDTRIVSAGNLETIGAVDNAGIMVLNSNSMSLSSVINAGNLQILSLTDTSGIINILSNVVNNSGDVLINARQISIDGALINNAGTTTVRGSDYAFGDVRIGSIDAYGGIINLDALAGLVSVDGVIDVTGGSLNVGANTRNLTAGDSINISGNLTANAASATNAGDVNVAGTGAQGTMISSTGGNINIAGNVSAVANDFVRSLILDSTVIDIAGNVTAANMGRLKFGDTLATHLNVDGALVSNAGGLIDLDVDDTKVGSLSGSGKFIARGQMIEATDSAGSAINIQNGIWFNGSDPSVGFVVMDTNDLTLTTSDSGANMLIAGGIDVGVANRLALDSQSSINVSGSTVVDGSMDVDAETLVSFANQIINNGTLTIDSEDTVLSDITNTGTLSMNSSNNTNVGNISNSGFATILANDIIAGAVTSTAGSMDITANSLEVAMMSITGGYANLNTNLINSAGNISVTGDLVQGGTTGMLNLTVDNTVLNANNLTVGGDFLANGYSGQYNLQNNFIVSGDIAVNSLADVFVEAESISADNVSNDGSLYLDANDIDLGAVLNAGKMEIDSGITNSLQLTSLTTTSSSTTKLYGTGINSSSSINLAGQLLQNASGALGGGDVNVIANNYTVYASDVTTAGISQSSGIMNINTSDMDINGNINATDLRIKAQGTDWLNVDVIGNVSGGVDFIGLEKMSIGGNYVFDNNSMLLASILSPGTTQSNYWATVSLVDDNTLGAITNGANAEPLISVNGKFISNLSPNNPNLYPSWNSSTVGMLNNGQVGVNIFDIVDQGDAIWLLYADGGVEDLDSKIRNAVVRYCNADGSICYNYMDFLGNGSANDDDLPIYISVRDGDGDGEADSLYLVFDPRFGGPVELFKIQPIVGREEDHTDGEYATAGALDDLLEGKIKQLGFYNRTPIELVPLIFDNTNMEEMAQELYDRMEQYILDRDGSALARFSRLFQPRELDQIVGSIALNEHTNFRDFEDRMFDEFIWNRHRNIKKAWLDADFGIFTQNASDDKKVTGDRFSIHGGFDWQTSEDTIFGLTGRVSHMSGSNFDDIDLSYKPGQPIRGRVDLDVADTNVGLGGYMMKILGTGTRLYGNAFLDLHFLSLSREQNFVAPITGSGTTLSIISEWGLLHDWLNQYLVGNLYARAGYNFGFSITEKSGGDDYMKLESDGYIILTPGYSLIAQKRIYTSSWFQLRPNISVGIEYDLLGSPDMVQFKFAPATKFTDYEVDIDPLWANAGVGIEFLSANGIQVGIDYRYQFNSDIQMHKFKIAGSYRF